jgi:hypothetical protein
MKKAGASEAEIKKANDKFEAERDARSNVNAGAGEDQENIDSKNGETASQKSQRSARSQRAGDGKQAEDED